MDDGVAAGPEVALATASAAARFGVDSGSLSSLFGEAASLGSLSPSAFLAAPGAVPLVADGRVVGGLGVGGADPAVCATVAAAVGAG
jgi:uncharacterized protein GlcG (DUF336 family)